MRSLLRKIVIALATVVSVGALFLLASFVRDLKFRREHEKDMRGYVAQAQMLESLGKIDFAPPELTYASLLRQLHEPTIRKPGSYDTTELGWACWKSDCGIRASFLIPLGRKIPENASPAVFAAMNPLFGNVRNVSIGGIRLGDTVETVQKVCRAKGYGTALNRFSIAWDEDWYLIWAGDESKISLLIFKNDKLIRSHASGTGLTAERNSE